MLTSCLLTLLATSPGFAQVSGAEQQPDNTRTVTAPAMTEQDSTARDLSKKNPKKINNATSMRPPSTQFTPTEKIRADDAVAFPVDI